MKKSLLIIVLCSLQCACASNTAVVSDEDTLLSYAELANEITVDYENIARRRADSRTDDKPIDTP